MPRAVLFAGPQKHTAIVSSGDIFDQAREARNDGGRAMEKQTAVRAM